MTLQLPGNIKKNRKGCLRNDAIHKRDLADARLKRRAMNLWKLNNATE